MAEKPQVHFPLVAVIFSLSIYVIHTVALESTELHPCETLEEMFHHNYYYSSEGTCEADSFRERGMISLQTLNNNKKLIVVCEK